ncbi:Gfo/Idh/MocA family oxidoreductase [Candidatus Woesearchaeota archaeon]|nr:Gfo/Idh/MocA family oxidoreductase [Candidatus Woesearchaeota archaeon]
MAGNINLAVVGAGRWGLNCIRAFSGFNDVDLSWVCSASVPSARSALGSVALKSAPMITADFNSVLSDSKVDAVAIITPGSTHYPLSKKALNAGKSVFVEKPAAFRSRDVLELVKLAEKKKLVFAVSDIHRFNPGIIRLNGDLKGGLFGKLDYVSVFHAGNGPVRADMSALWDFFPHSASISMFLSGESPVKVSAAGGSFLKQGIEDVVTMKLSFKNSSAFAFGSWLYPLKKMEVVVVGEKLYSVFDDYAKDKLNYSGSPPRLSAGRFVVDDDGAKPVPVSGERPLTGMLRHFADCVKKGRQPINGGMPAVQVARVLESAQKSLAKGGSPVII